MKNHSRAAVVALVCSLAVAALGQTPSVVTTLPPPPDGSSSTSSQFTAVGDAIYFFASRDAYYGDPTIWKWTAGGGSQVVKRLVSETSAHAELMAFGNKLLFNGRIDNRGYELWISDGTAAGTTLVKDIYVAGSSSPVLLAVAGAKAFFSAYDPEHGRELWVTDGTEAGTALVADLTGDSTSSSPVAAVTAGGRVYFQALNQLWVSDGTAAGTISLASDVSGTTPGVLNGEVFFLAADGVYGRELWSTDGTVAGTAMVADINPGLAPSWGAMPTSFVQTGSSLLFFAEDAANGRELWRTDGSAAGTQLVEDLTPGPGSTALDRLQSSQTGAFFVVGGAAVWFTDGTAAGTAEVGSWPRVRWMTAAPNGAYFATDTAALMFSDGSVGGAIEIGNVTPSGQTGTAVGARVAFVGTNGTFGYEPWLTDGTAAGTQMMGDIGSSTYSGPSWMMSAGANVFFGAGLKLYRSDGTAPGTIMVGTIGQSSYPYYLNYPAAALGSSFLYFGSDASTTGLMKSDGTVAGTTLIRPFYEVNQMFASGGGYALFTGRETNVWNSRTSLWSSDATANGTRQLTQADAAGFVDLAGRTYFLGPPQYYYQTRWRGLWVTTGSPESTLRVADGSYSELGTAAGMLFLAGEESATGTELWRSDGTAEGTVLVKDIAPGNASSGPSMFVASGNLLFFVANDGVHGSELWRSDGTEAGTFLVGDVVPGSESSNITGLTASGRFVYFNVPYGGGTGLWRSDGTPAGTVRLSESGFSSPTPFDGRLMGTSTDSFRGTELWESDGSIAGTFAAFDLTPGTGSSSPRNLTVARDHMFFSTVDARLWTLSRAATRVSIAERRVTEGNAGSTVLQFPVTRTGTITGATTVTWTTEDVTATAGSDYQTASGTLTFAAGESTKNVSITILGDVVTEANESFAVTLTGATGGTIVRDRAFGLIEDDDRRVALTVAYVPTANGRKFRITNAGPSGATVRLAVSESPLEGTFDCDDRNPSTCDVGLVRAGESVDFVVSLSSDELTTHDPAFVPGHTLTATVSAVEAETNLADNTVATMINVPGNVSVPSFLTAGTAATAFVTAYGLPTTVDLSMSGGIVVSPSSASVTTTNPVASFALNVASNAWGWSTVRSGGSTVMRVPIVLPGEEPRLDTAMVLPRYYNDYQFGYDEPVVIPVRVVGTLPDGTRPSGTIQLRRVGDDSLVQSKTLDADGSAEFNVTGLPVGAHELRVVYGGDLQFNALSLELETVQVSGWNTYVQGSIAGSACGASEIFAVVWGPEEHTPTGTVTFLVDGVAFASVALAPSATAGQATASATYAFPSSWASVTIEYVPDAPFEASSDWAYASLPACPAPTLIASAASASSVSLVWSDVGADQYEILRSEAPTKDVFASVGTTGVANFVDATVTTGKAYLYQVVAKNSAGDVRSTSAPDLATAMIFADDPIVFRQTRVRALHVTQLQQAANAVRTLAGLAPVTFTPVAAGGSIRPAEIAALRTAIGEGLGALGQVVPAWADGVSSGSAIKGLPVQQLRNAVK